MSKIKTVAYRLAHTIAFAVAIIAIIALAVIVLDDDPFGERFKQQLNAASGGTP
ncbi:MAG: hypothetical protein JJ916_04175 [Phycisphaerales bacterium]|nr:hypothetical protein [Phycisphaerales bacterium]